MPTTIDSAGIIFNDTSTITSANTFISKPASPSNGQVLSYNGSTWTGAALSDSPATAKAWVVFNGNGTVAIQKDYNVTSVTDLGVSNYRVNFDTNTMADANYTITGTLWDVPTGVSGVDNYASGDMYFGTNNLTPVTQTYFEFFAIGVSPSSGYDPLKITIVCHN